MLNHKTIKTILTITALCLISLARAEEPVFEFKYSEEEAKLYRMPIKQITPKDGIWTGHVIAYGHYIKPPYKVEVKIVNGDTGVYINNVKVEPPMYLPGFQPKKSRQTPAQYDSIMKYYQKQFIAFREQLGLQQSLVIMDSLLERQYDSLQKEWYGDSLQIIKTIGSIREHTLEIVLPAMYWVYRNQHNIEASCSLLINFARDSLGLKKVSLYDGEGGKGINWTWDEDGYPSCHTYGFEMPPERAESLRVSRARYNRMDYHFKICAENYRDHLKSGGTLFLGWHLDRSASGPMLFEKFLEVMTRDIDIEEKARRLRELRFSPKSVKQLIYNFDIKEYPNQGGKK